MPDKSPNPSELDGLDPGELLARGLNTVQPTGGARGWSPPAPEELAAILPQYRIEALLGHGGMGAVYRGVQIALDRPVAIKLLPLEVSADRDFADRFAREARTLAKLSHPNIVAVHDFGKTTAGHLYFVMEFVEGTDLHKMIHGPGLSPAQSLTIIIAVCEALQYAHGKGVVHRDIKPANVMVSTEGTVKVADFGLARLNSPDADSGGLTMTGTVMGTPAYMAPEQTRGMNVDHRADIYSLGVMLYEMLCGEIPRGVFDPPSRKVQVDVRLDEVVLKAMNSEPERRYQHTVEMKTDVERIRTTPEQHKPAPKPKSKSRVAALIAVCLVLASAAGLLIWKKGEPSPGGTRSVVSLTSSADAAKGVGASASPAQQTLDLLALVDEQRDRLRAEGNAGANQWTKSGGQLVFTSSDKRPGKISAPVSLNGLRDYEVEVVVPDSPVSAIVLDFPTSATKQASIAFVPGKSVAVRNEKQELQEVGTWPKGAARPPWKLAARAKLDADGVSGTLSATINGLSVGEWRGALAQLGRSPEAHPEFPGQLVPALYVPAGDRTHSSWTLRVFDGEAKVLRRAAVSPSPSLPVSSSPAEPWRDALADLKLVGLAKGERTAEGLVMKKGTSGILDGTGRRNGAIRIQAVREGTGNDVKIQVRSHFGGGGTYQLGLSRDRQAQLAGPKQPTGDTAVLKDFPLPNPIQPGETYSMELRIVGSTLTASVNGVVLGSVEDSMLPEGDFRIVQNVHSSVLIRALEFLPLPDDRAASPAPAQQSSPALQRVEPSATAGRPDGLKPSTTLPAAAPAPIRIWDAPEKLPANVPGMSWQDGVVAMEKQTRAVAGPGGGLITGHNLIVRYSLRMNRNAEWATAYVRDSGIPTAPHAYKFQIQAGGGKAELIGEHGTPNRVLARWKLPRTYAEDEWVRVELRAVGNDFTVSIDGQPLGTVRDDEPSRPGFLGFSATGKGYFRDLEYVPLDATPATATKEKPFVNQSGMQFVPVPITGGPTDGKRVLFSVWETRVQDYEAFAKATKRKWEKPDYAREATVPAIFVSWDDAQDFCAWLTEREQKTGKLAANERYRLPADHEWSCAVGIGDREDPGNTPEEKDGKISDVYPWGTGWPGPLNTANFFGREADEEAKAGRVPGLAKGMAQHLDYHVRLAPVGSYPANPFGIHDLGGNVSELCEDWWNPTQAARTLRGGSWVVVRKEHGLSAHRAQVLNNRGRDNYFGFRVVLVPAAASAAGPAASAAPAAEKWVNARQDENFSKGSSMLRVSTGGWVVQNQGRRFLATGPRGDGAVRIRTLFHEKDNLLIVVRSNDAVAAQDRYESCVLSSGDEVSLNRWASGKVARALNGKDALAKRKLPVPLKPGEEYELEVRVVGDLFTVKLQGNVLIEARDATLAEGFFGIAFAATGVEVPVSSIEYLDLGGSAPAAQTPQLGGEVRTFGGHRYQFVPEKQLKWSEAKAKAEAMGGHLATIGSEEETEWIVRTFQPFLAAGARLYLGGFAESKAAPWQWVTGEPFQFQRWPAGEPNFTGSDGKPAPGPFALHLLARTDKSVAWDEAPQAWPASTAFLVEWDDEGKAPPASAAPASQPGAQSSPALQREEPSAPAGRSDGLKPSTTLPAAAATTGIATKDAPFVNTLGMKFVPVPITGGPTGGQRVLFSVWETRVQDFRAFAKDTNDTEWIAGNERKNTNHPWVVNWNEATAFCAWLTERERKAGMLGANERYRLPSDHEWSCAVGIGDREDPAQTPAEKGKKLENVFPWGSAWPPAGAGNYAGEEVRELVGKDDWKIDGFIAGYTDTHKFASSPGSFPANAFGLYDLGGNLSELCEDWMDGAKRFRVTRGGSWVSHEPAYLGSSHRNSIAPTVSSRTVGFRVVLAPVP